MQISILTLGTRGDVQPFIALAQELKRRKHDVVLATGLDFKRLVESHHIKFHAVRSDYQSLLKTEDGMKLLKSNPVSIRKYLNNFILPFLNEVILDYYAVARNSDLIIYRPKTFAHSFINQLSAKAIQAAVVPGIASTSDFSNPVMGGLQWLPKVFNRLTYSANQFIYNWFNNRLKQLRLENGWGKPNTSDIRPALYGISKAFLPQPVDWPSNHLMTGFWFTRPEETTLNRQVSDFLTSDRPPILLTLGSMSLTGHKQPFENLLTAALKQSNERLIVVKGWQKWNVPAFADNERIMFVDEVQYEKVLPRVKAVIHHGGIGTIAECLRAGKPMLICPVLRPLGDQMFWGKQVEKIQCGLKPVYLSKLDPYYFVQQIKQLSSDKKIHQRAALISARIRKENGVATAADILEKSS